MGPHKVIVQCLIESWVKNKASLHACLEECEQCFLSQPLLRIVDVYVNGAVHEVITGAISPSKEMEHKIQRDLMLRSSGQANELFWR